MRSCISKKCSGTRRSGEAMIYDVLERKGEDSPVYKVEAPNGKVWALHRSRFYPYLAITTENDKNKSLSNKGILE